MIYDSLLSCRGGVDEEKRAWGCVRRFRTDEGEARIVTVYDSNRVEIHGTVAILILGGSGRVEGLFGDYYAGEGGFEISEGVALGPLHFIEVPK